ncbi:hypothetical protein F66182_4548 [Fusarium sp. NRRL 66182]|nr:hypothetical protein F66182_4548 [Fusarium sp. NRRL 66182]
MTPSIVEALTTVEPPETPDIEADDDASSPRPTEDPSLDDPQVGNPIKHGQIVGLWKGLKAQGNSNFTLEQLLHGAFVYIPPPPPKPEPSAEYKALMARLRRQEEARSYERMINPVPHQETFKDRFPHSAAAFAEVNRPTSASDIGEEDIAMEEVHKQITLIINFLVSIAGVAGTLWVTARWWSLPSRLFLTMGGSILVAIAEVAVYSAYMWKMEEGRRKHVIPLEYGSSLTYSVIRMSDSPAPSQSRPRAKPLRTYGKRSTPREASPKESTWKRRRISTEVSSSEATTTEKSKTESESLPKIIAQSTKDAPEPPMTANNPATESIKKGTILNFFKPIPSSSSTIASSPKSDEPQPEATPPSSPPQPKTEARKKPRLLRFRGTSLPLLDSDNTEGGNQDETEAGGSGGNPTRPALRESSLNRESTKPSCQRCQTSKRQCDGYLPEDSTVTRRQLAGVARQISVVGPISQALLQYPRYRSRSASPSHLSLFDVFRDLTAPSTASFIPSRFWTRELLQLAHSEPAVWHATLALGALHRRHEMYWQGQGHHGNEGLWSQANENYARAISYAAHVKDPIRLLSLSLALVSITNMMGRWSESKVHIMAGHGLLSQAGHGVETMSAAEMLTRLDLQAMTFSDSSAPYAYRDAPRAVRIDQDVRGNAQLESYGQAGTALFGLMRRLMMVGETWAGNAGIEDYEMVESLTQDIASWEYKMGQFEKNHANPHDEMGAVSVRLYHTLLRMCLTAGGYGPETRWDRLLGYYERILTLAETLRSSMSDARVHSPLSLEPGLIVPVFMVAQRCRHPWLRRRAIGFLHKIKRQEGMWFSDGAAAVAQRIMEIEGQVFFESDLAKWDSSPATSAQDGPWEAWATEDGQQLPVRTSWAGIERVSEVNRVRETLVMVEAEEKRVELSLIMSAGDELGSFGEVRSETVTYA